MGAMTLPAAIAILDEVMAGNGRKAEPARATEAATFLAENGYFSMLPPAYYLCASDLMQAHQPEEREAWTPEDYPTEEGWPA